MARSITIFDADACPVNDEVYRVAGRNGLHVSVIANSAFTECRASHGLSG